MDHINLHTIALIPSVLIGAISCTNAYCSAPSSAPARASMLTGQDFWRLEEAANLWGSFPDKFKTYTDILATEGYHVGYEGKGWGPGDYEAGGWKHNPAGRIYNTFEEFYGDYMKESVFH